MLILSRKPGDAILIDGGIRVIVLACDGGGVRLGIEAPSSVGIVREEIVKDIADENIRAGADSGAKSFLESLEPGESDADDGTSEESPASDSGH